MGDAGDCPPCPGTTLNCIDVGPGLTTSLTTSPLAFGECQVAETILKCGGSGTAANGAPLSRSVTNDILVFESGGVLLNCQLPCPTGTHDCGQRLDDFGDGWGKLAQARARRTP